MGDYETALRDCVTLAAAGDLRKPQLPGTVAGRVQEYDERVQTTIDPARAEDVAGVLAAWAASRLGVAELRFAERPEQVAHGWDTHTYFFRLHADDVPANARAEWARPLVLRLYADAEQSPRAAADMAKQRFAAERGFPAARPIAEVDAGASPLRLPLAIMERLHGEPMLHRVARNPLRAWRGCAEMADLHVALHVLDPAGWPVPEEGTLVDRRLAFLRDSAERFDFHDLDARIAWLDAHKSAVIPEELSVCHGDFHPLNILVDHRGRFSVVDWGSAYVGDRHADVANTLLELARVPTTSLPMTQRALAAGIRRLVARRYVACYRRRRALEPARLRYWEAFGSIGWALQFALMIRDGAAALGLKADTAGYVRPAHVAAFCRHFDELTRV